MQTDNMATMPTARGLGVGVEIPLTPLDMESFVDISDILQNSTREDDLTRAITDDKFAYQFDDDESSVISPHSVSDNAIDPSVYLRHAHENMPSTSSWASSPYGEPDTLSAASSPCSPFTPGVQNNPPQFNYYPTPSATHSINTTPDLARQMSLNVVMEVLGTCPVNHGQPDANFDVHSPASSCTFEEDDLQHPSPSYVGFIAPMQAPCRSRVFSDFLPAAELPPPEDRTRAFSMDVGLVPNADFSDFLPFENYIATGGIMEDSDTGSPVNNENNNSTTNASPDCASSPLQTTPSVEPTPFPTSVPDSVNTKPIEQSIGMSENSLMTLLDDFMAATDPATETTPTSEGTVHSASASVADHAYSTPPKTIRVEVVPSPYPQASAPIIDLTDDKPSTSAEPSSSVPNLKRTASYKRKRTQNNKACRESRKKRRMRRDEAENRMVELTEENDAMRKKIKDLEVEVKETRSILMSRLSGNL